MISEPDLQLLQRSWLRSFTSYQPNNHSYNQALFENLLESYSEPQRKYHTLQHLVECIQKFELVIDLVNFPREVEVALWFHDAIYDVQGHDNEALSADWAKESLVAVGASTDEIDLIYHLIMVTQHTNVPKILDEQTLVDIDLSILGERIERFKEYDIQVRQEYAWVAEEIYRVKRCEVLQMFLARPSIYSTDYFQKHFEAQARENLKHSIEQLKK
jgi:predicted metal-dependent HD superfamily phosphohydrolase